MRKGCLAARGAAAVSIAGLLCLLLAGCGQFATTNRLRTQFVALRYLAEAQRLAQLHPLDRPNVRHCIDRALALSADDRIILPKAIGLYMRLDEYSAALQCIGRFTALTGARLPLERGQCLLMTGYKAEGRALIYRAVLEARAQWLAHGANPAAYASALNGAGYTLADADMDLDAARQMIEKAVELAPLKVEFVDSLGWVLFRAGDLRRAAFYMERATRQMASEGDPTVYYHLGAVYAAQGKHSEAERALRKAIAVDPYNKPANDALRRLRYRLPAPGRV